MQPQLPEPRPNADSIEYWTRAAEDRLVLRQCGSCGRHHFPPRQLCPACWSDRLHWRDASGEAHVYTFTVMHRAPLAEFASQLPYVVALVDLAEGPRMMVNIVGDDARSLRIGETVKLCFEQRGRYKLPQFQRLRR